MSERKAHLLALFTIVVWGVTFVSTKILLETFSATEILFMRFALAYLVLMLLNHRRTKDLGWKAELLFLSAGMSGIFGYYLLENISLSYTSASNTGVIVSSAPLFTALFARLAREDRSRPGLFFYAGFVVAMAGIILISVKGEFTVNTKGDLLALLASAVWGVYAVLSRKIAKLGINTIEATRRIFFYGIIFIFITLIASGPGISADDFSFVNVFNILFLSVLASAICFVTWNSAVGTLGSIKTSVYIYLNPVVTIIFSFIVLSEPLTLQLAAGCLLTLAGLFLSSRG